VAPEYAFLRHDLILFTYLHLAADRWTDRDAVGPAASQPSAYETVQTGDGKLPLLVPMSEGGRAAWRPRSVASYLERTPRRGGGC